MSKTKHPPKRYKYWYAARSWSEPEVILGAMHERSSLNPVTGCLEWNGYTARGYGMLVIDKKRYVIHRIAAVICLGWKWAKRQRKLTEANGWIVCHRCDNPRCWNPEHLFKGTSKTNTVDSVQKGRHFTAKLSARTVCARGHEYTEENTKWVRGGRSRQCRICMWNHSWLQKHPNVSLQDARRRGPYAIKGKCNITGK